MKIIIAGGRDFDDYDYLEYCCDKLFKDLKWVEIVSGGQRTWNHATKRHYGADFLGECYAHRKGIRVKKFPAKWKSEGKSAGVIRNQKMADYADGLVAFWDGKSRGTRDMIMKAKKKGLEVKIKYYNI